MGKTWDKVRLVSPATIQLVQAFLRDGLITDMVITTVAVLIGSGRPLFGAVPHDIELKPESSRSFLSGLVWSAWRVVRQPG